MSEPMQNLPLTLADRYELERELGAGAMARVYLALDRKHDRRVAVKVLRPEIAYSIGPERFLREVRFAAKLSHPHILPLFDSGNDNGLLYYVMPNVEGQSLRDRMEHERKLPIQEAVHIAQEVADAVDYAHRHGIVHRDVKPENIMLQDGHALVADFGIGRAMSAVDEEMFTRGGVAVGTPAYMSPEQASGDAVDGRSDIYSLGCVLYEMLAGEQLFTGPTAQAVIAKRFVQTPVDVSALRDGVPRSIARAVHRALARAPIDRHETAAAFAMALGETDATLPAFIDAPEKSIAVLPFVNMSADPENEFFADGITEDILNALSHIRELRVVGRTSVFSFKGKNHDLRAIGEQLHVRTILEGSVRRSGNRVRITSQLLDVANGHHLWSERYDREIEDVFAVQDEIAMAIAERMKTTFDGTPAAALAERATDNIDAYQAYLKGRALLYRRGPWIRQGMAMMEQALVLDPNYGLALAGLADVHSLLGGVYNLVPPKDAAEKARHLASRALEVAPNLSEANSAMAMVSLLFDWEFDVAEGLFKRALELNPGYSQGAAWYYLFYVGSACARWPEAIVGMIRLARLDTLSGYLASVLAVAHSVGGDPDEALRWSDRAIELDPHSYLTLSVRQSTFIRLKQWTRALDASDAVLVAFGRRHIPLARLCAIFVELGQPEEAHAVYQEMLSRHTLSRAHREYVSLAMLAVVASAVGDSSTAMGFARDAFRRRDPQLVFMGREWPEFEYLRRLPEFQEILAAMKLPGWTPAASPSK